MKSLIIVFTTLSVMSPTGDFQKPVSYGQGDSKKLSAINVVTSFDSDVFIKVKDQPVTYDELRYQAMYNCRFNKEPSLDIIEKLIRVEKHYNPPPSMRGMILAAACMESGFNPYARGDRKFSKDKRTPMAIGILQLWPIYEKMYPGLQRTNAEEAAIAWMSHIVKKIPKVKRQCKYKTPKRIWLAAWVTGIRYKKPGGRCKERPKHYRLLKKWHRQIKKDRLESNYCVGKDACGC